MKHVHAIFAVTATALLAACAAQPSQVKPGSASEAHVVMSNVTFGAVRPKILASCSDNNMTPVYITHDQVVCEQTTPYNLRMGLRQSFPTATGSYLMSQFTMHRSGNDVNVTARQWAQLTVLPRTYRAAHRTIPVQTKRSK